ncbi:MAG: SGNH/GDSL hydrolase family protein [Candidatus Woesearchaeota archaeon]|nr:SGNH/GDSL hydrolase family protein [Candidatus Woesearchaeota archaeon]
MRKRIIRAVLGVLLFLVLFLAALEITTRLVYRNYGYGYPPGLTIKDDINGYRYKPGFRGNFFGSYSNITISINSRGFRDYEYALEKPADSYRIAVIGDSVTFGSGIPMQETYAKQLEKMLNSNSSVRYEVLNMGVNSYEFEQEYNLLKSDGLKFKPDLVIVGFVLNDVGKVDAKSVQFREIILRQCQFCVFAKTLSKTISLNGANYNSKYFEYLYKRWQGISWNYTSDEIRELSMLAKRDNFTLMFVVFPYSEQFMSNPDESSKYESPDMPQQHLRTLLEEENVGLIDLMDDFDAPGYQKYFLKGDSLHLTGEGYSIVAERIYSVLKENGIAK